MTHVLAFLFISTQLIYGQNLSHIQNNMQIDMHNVMIGKTIWFFFSEHCSICHMQVKEFDCLKNKDHIFAVGFAGNKKKLWKESKKMQLKKKGFKNIFTTDVQGAQQIGLIENVSPQILIFNNDKKIKHFLGITTCKQLQQIYQ